MAVRGLDLDLERFRIKFSLAIRAKQNFKGTRLDRGPSENLSPAALRYIVGLAASKSEVQHPLASYPFEGQQIKSLAKLLGSLL